MAGSCTGLSPLAKISNGYGFVTDAEGKRLSQYRQADRAGDAISTADCRRKNPGAGDGN
ncbi:MAG: hypothetical protein ACLUD2_04135 [Clostridium sp.]